MAWLLGGGSTSAPLARFDALLEQATSELQPTPTISAGSAPETLQIGLDMADLIRSGQVKPSEAVKGVRRRLAHVNPNVKLYTLMTLDVAIKNAGDGFLKEVANGGTAGGALPGVGARGLVEELGELARASSNSDVKTLILRLLQNWATAFESKSNLAISELVLMYRRLKHEGQPFPQRDPSATAAMIDSMAAPEWTESDVCSRCREPFTVLNRRHHCRACGNIFDQKCSSKTMPLPQFGITDDVRVCDGCFKKIRSGGGRRASMDPTASPRPSINGAERHRYSMSSSLPTTSSMHARGPTSRSQEDADLQRALELSLAESRGQSNGRSASPSFALRDGKANGARSIGVEDPELAAAIEASLREMQIAQPEPSSSSPYGSAAPVAMPNVPKPYDLPIRDVDTILTFSQNVSHARSSNRPPSLLELTPALERATASRPNLVRAVQDASKRQQILTEMGDKLTHAVRLYDQLLEQQVAKHSMPQSYHSLPPTSYGQPYAPAPNPLRPQYASPEPAPPSHMYPSLPNDHQRYASPSVPEPHYASYAPAPQQAPSWQSAASRSQQTQHTSPPQHFSQPPQPQYAPSPEQQFRPYGSYAAHPSQHAQSALVQAPPQPGPSAPMATKSQEAAGFIASAPPESPALDQRARQSFAEGTGQWQGSATESAPDRQSEPSYAQPSAPPASAPPAPAPAGRVYSETSFPTAPSANPWDEEVATPELDRRAEAPLIEF